MAILLSAQNLEKSFGSQLLFRGLSFGIETGDRIGLIGPNGAGKTTLLKILAGIESSDGGEIAKSRGLRLGYLEQNPIFPQNATLLQALAGERDESDGQVQAWIARLELDGAGLEPETPIENLSGGWKKRVALARELVREPDLLLLDEPTNHLDLQSILWLEELLAEARFATLTITHDRLFLERVANRIFDLDKRNPDGLLVVRGTYTDYVEAKQNLMHAQQRRADVVANTLRRETEWLRRGAKARQTKQRARIDRAGELASEAEDLAARNLNRTAQIEFESAERNPQKLIQAKAISKAYDGQKLFGPLDLMITPKTRLGLLGRNGCGKSTLIRVLLGTESPDSGVIERAENLKVAYFAQYREELDLGKTVLRTICPEGDYVSDRGNFIVARAYLDRFLFRRDQMDMPVEKLSGGEKSRLRLAQLMLDKSNVLVLDEPTNDLDLDTLNVLEDAVRNFDGAVIIVTHDRFFLDQVSKDILAFTRTADGEAKLEKFAGYGQWEEWAASQPKQSAKKAAAKEAAKSSKRRLGYNEKRELDGMEQTILGKEERLKALQAEAEKPDVISDATKLSSLYSEIAELEKTIERLYARWAELEALAN